MGYARDDRPWGGADPPVVTSSIETYELRRVDPQAWLSATLARLVSGYAASEVDELTLWTNTPDVAREHH